jgi:hypothetical protein
MPPFGRGIQHPFYPALKPSPAARARGGCAALAGTCYELLRGPAAGVVAERAVFPLRRPVQPFLTADEREALWALYQVPVYAILLDVGGRVIGYECEAQEGFHLAPGYAGGFLFGNVDATPCECGRAGLRLLPQERYAELAISSAG